MIPTNRLLYKLKSRLNKLVSNEHQEIAEEDMLLALNEQQNILVKNKLSTNNLYHLGLDGFKKRYQDLEFLIEPYSAHQLPVVLTDANLNRYTINISSITPQFMFFIDAYVTATKGKCTNQILNVAGSLTRHDSLSTLLDSDIYKPSFEWRELIGDITADAIGFYSDGTFTISSANICYLRYPKRMDISGYINLDNEISTDVDCELPAYMEDELLDLAELSLALNTNNNQSAQNAELRMKNNE